MARWSRSSELARSTRATSKPVATQGCWSRWITSGSRCACFRLRPERSSECGIAYYQQLDFDYDRANYTYPLATLARTAIDEKTTGRFSFALDVKSEVPVVNLSSPSHADQFVIVKHADAHYLQASLESSGADLGHDLVVSCELERPTTGVDLITSKQKGEDGYFMATITAGQELEQQLKGSDYIFVVDVSGSMVHDGETSNVARRGRSVRPVAERARSFRDHHVNIAATLCSTRRTLANDESKGSSFQSFSVRRRRWAAQFWPPPSKPPIATTMPTGSSMLSYCRTA